MGSWIAWWASLLGFYLLLVGKLTWPESVAGALAATLFCATGATAAVLAGHWHFRPHLHWLRQVVGLPVRAGRLRDRRRRALASRGASPASGKESSARSRSTQVTRMVSPRLGAPWLRPASASAPNTFVVAIDREHRILVVHQLVPSARAPGGGNREWPL